MNKAYRYRIYPDEAQKELFARTFGCCRFVWNRMLEEKQFWYEKTGRMERVTPAKYKYEFEWLKEVDAQALCNTQLQLEKAFNAFFGKRAGYPKFKSKKNPKRSYTTNLIGNNIRIEGTKIRLPKAGLVSIKLHRQIPEDHKIKSVTVSQEPSGKYYVSILTEYEAEEKALTNGFIGLDYSSGELYVDSNGNIPGMPRFYREAEDRLAREQRKLSGMVRGSKNYNKQKIRVARAYEKVRNCRKDFQHKLSREIANQYGIVCVEDLNMRDLSSKDNDIKLGKPTYDNGFGQFRTLLSYKLEENGGAIVTVDRWYASSKTCHECGYVKEDLQLSDREWKCPCCGRIHDRDINAAINIRNAGINQLFGHVTQAGNTYMSA